MAQLVKGQILDLGSGHDLWVVRLSPTLGSTLNMEPVQDSLSLPPSAPPLLVCFFSLKINKSLKKEECMKIYKLKFPQMKFPISL